MKKIYCLLIALAFCAAGMSQQAAAVDSMKKSLAAAKTVEEKVDALDALSRTLMNVKPQDADEYGKQLIIVAEESRNRALMFKAYMSNGTRCRYFAGMQTYTNQAIGYFERALAVARENKMDEETGSAYLKLANVYLSIPDKEKALSYANHAFSIISLLKNDSLLVEANNIYGNVYLASNEKILALRHYFTALRIAEQAKNASLIRFSYLNLSDFYAIIEDYDKAID